MTGPTHTDLPAVKPALVGEQVYNHLEAAILTGRFPGGMRLRVRQLAEMVGTSVMPVRDAISRLEEVGLATRTAHRGAVVKEFSSAELAEVYAVRTLLEETAAREGALRATAEDLRLMRQSYDQMATALAEGRINDAMAADSAMLMVLYRASGNRVLCSLIEALWKQCHYYRIMVATMAHMHHDDTIWQSEREIFQAALARDEVAAAAATRVSLESATRTIRQADDT